MPRQLLLLILACLPALSGCLQVDTALELDTRGGGVFSMSIEMDAEVERAVSDLFELGGEFPSGLIQPSLLESLDEDALRESCAEAGVSLDDFRTEEREGRLRRSATLSFPTLASLRRALSGKLGASGGPSLHRTANGDYILIHGQETENGGSAQAEADAEEAMTAHMLRRMEELDEDQQGRLFASTLVLMQHSPEMIVTYRVTAPGRVLSHNAEVLEDRTCSWKLNASEAAALVEDPPRIVFSGQGLHIDAPAWE